ncbi:MAG: DUF4390 domain-containing protein [Gammaproteobacteria bacterium]|nr:DUF4390 domain-containing protein [Gammaproteobacteria bacterium]
MNLILLLKRAITVLLVISITTLMYAFVSESAQARTIAIEVNYLNIAELNDELRLDAEIAYELNSEVREALINGIPMVFQVEVQIVALQKWLWDKVIITTVKTHLLKYHILSKQYVLENLETGESVSFPDLESVLSKQGSVSAMYIAETDYLKEKENYVVQLRSRLLSSELPLPLRMKSYFSPKWRLDSGWYQWPL